MIRQSKPCLLGAVLLWLSSATAWGWSQPQPISAHQHPMRSVALPATSDAAQWARQQGLDGWQLQRAGDGRQFVNFRAGDANWQRLQGQCDPSNPLAPQCLNDSCQSIQNLDLRATLPADTQGWLTPRAPDLDALLAGRPDSCPNDRSAQPWNGALPEGADPACWTLQLARPCQSEETPAEYLKPHWRMNQLVVILPDDGSDPSTWAANLGLQVLEVTTLRSTGDRLVRLLRPITSGTSLDAWVDLLGNIPSVLGVQKDLAYFTLAGEASTAAPSSAPSPAPEPFAPAVAAPSDPLDAFNYGHALTAADRLTERYDGAEVAVAVIDTGIDTNHPELENRIAERLDFSGRGYSADAHGTGVAAIIAAARGNGIGASGVAPAVRIHSFKACQPRQPNGLAAQCWSSSLIKALDAAINADIPLINMSLGGPPSPLLQRLIEAASARGLLVLAAAGNGGPNARELYPAAWPQTLAVTAVDADRRLYAMANRGDYVGVAAPGVDIITAGPRNGQPLLSGTSMATAHVTGVAALLLQLAPDSRAPELAPLLRRHSHDLGTPGADPMFGTGLLDACASARELLAQADLCGGAP